MAALPTTRQPIAVLDRTKEPGAVGEPLYQAVVTALAEAMDGDTPPFAATPRVIGGRYGLSSKEFTPAMVKPVFDELLAARPKRHFTVGIYDDVTHLSLPIATTFRTRGPPARSRRCSTASARTARSAPTRRRSRSSARAPTSTPRATSSTTRRSRARSPSSHLRFGPQPIRSTYLVDDADFVACHQFGLLQSVKVLDHAKHGATFLLNSPVRPGRGLGAPAGRDPAPARRQADRPLGDRRDGGGRRDRHGQPHQHDHAALLLPPRRACSRPTRRSRGSRTSSRRPTPSAARPSSTATSRPSTSPSRAWAT